MNDTAKQSNSEQVYERLRNLILDGDLPAGTPLRASMLASEYGFGLTPLREALTRLQSECLVTANFNRGFKVAESSIEELTDLGRVRSLIETQMLIEAMERGAEEWESAIVAAHYQLSKTPVPALSSDRDIIAAYDERHDAFHRALTSACQSEWLNRLAEQIGAQLQRYHRNTLADARSAVGKNAALRQDIETTLNAVMGVECHTNLMDVVLERDAEKSTALMREHVQLTSHAYLKLQELVAEHKAA